MARNNNPESYQNFLDNFGSADVFTGKPYAPYTGPTQEEFEAEERARLGDDLFFKYYPDAQRDDVSQPNTTGGLGGLGSIFDILKNRMPAPPVSDGGPMKRYPFPMPPGKGQGPRSMQFIDENRNGIDDRDEENVTPLPSPFKQLPRGPAIEMPDSRPQMPDPDMLQKLQEALRQKQNLEIPATQRRPPPMRGDMPQKRPPLMRGDMRKKGGLGGVIEQLALQAAQKAEQPQMPARPQPRGGMFGGVEDPQSTRPYKGGMFGRITSQGRGGSGGILPRAGNGPTPEQMRRIINGINVRGIGI